MSESELTPNPDIKEIKPLAGKVAVITGTSRGIGRGTALSLAEAGATVVGCYVSEGSEKRQNTLGTEIEAMGGKFVSVRADITTADGRRALVNAATDLGQGIDVLVLNAAGGFEKDKDYGYADVINNYAQVDLLDEALPHMNSDSDTVLVTSNWAHGYGAVRIPPFYREIARSKRAGEDSLLAKRDEMAKKGNRLSVFSTRLVSETGAYSVMSHISKDGVKAMEEREGKSPTPKETGDSLREFLLSAHDSGEVYFAGGDNAEPLPPEHIGPVILDRAQIEAKLEMYDNSVRNRVMVDRWESSADRMSGTAWYTARDEDAVGHFKEEYGGKLVPAHERIEMAGQAVGLLFMGLEPDAVGAAATLDGLSGEVDFTGGGKGGFIFPGDEVEMKVEMVSMRGATDICGSVKMYVKGREVTSIEQIWLGILPDGKMAIRLMDRARRNRTIDQPQNETTE
ncbi:MAG TPA: SDR family oxidoreductase [Patescibacteria group bacterium]|nr:SDR family oxidoreductase [Patescibacteria group bacterium]